jgi:hypothetical protein
MSVGRKSRNRLRTSSLGLAAAIGACEGDAATYDARSDCRETLANCVIRASCGS